MGWGRHLAKGIAPEEEFRTRRHLISTYARGTKQPGSKAFWVGDSTMFTEIGAQEAQAGEKKEKENVSPEVSSLFQTCCLTAWNIVL